MFKLKIVKIIFAVLFYSVLWFGAFSLNNLLFNPDPEKIKRLIEAIWFGIVFAYMFDFEFSSKYFKNKKKQTN